jgi:hypothetical protein
MCIYNALRNDVAENATTVDETLEQIVQKAESFIRSNQLWNRDEFQRAIKDIFKRKGVFACALGGNNTGKSLAMQDKNVFNSNI